MAMSPALSTGWSMTGQSWSVIPVDNDRRATTVRLTQAGPRAVCHRWPRSHEEWVDSHLDGRRDCHPRQHLSDQLECELPARVAKEEGSDRMTISNTAVNFRLNLTDGIAEVSLDRPERKNPLTFESYAELRDWFRGLVYRDDVKVVIFGSNGGNFCSGGDVFEIIGPLLDKDMKGLHGIHPHDRRPCQVDRQLRQAGHRGR
jgi:hypothetical protein